MRRRHAPVECDVMRPQLHCGALAPGAEREHEVAADVVHGIDNEAQILQCGTRRIGDGQAENTTGNVTNSSVRVS